jgi:hypothetical protein
MNPPRVRELNPSTRMNPRLGTSSSSVSMWANHAGRRPFLGWKRFSRCVVVGHVSRMDH